MNQKGYYILEFLLVFVIISSLYLLTPVIKQENETATIEKFVEKLAMDLNYAQLQSSLTFDIINVEFKHQRYQIKRSNGEVIRSHDYSDKLTVTIYFPLNRIRYSHGMNMYAGQLLIRCGSTVHHYRLLEKGGWLQLEE